MQVILEYKLKLVTARRTGVQQSITVQTSRFSTGDRIVEVNFVPFMRTRLVAFSATR